ncbi:hypothetical protein BDZ91DRAFT_781193 [Kalaharituber pfeilii]|nr:hypothetical protein BDZ91DRAFT_781193 [Kalaharituber pfeilii]
MIFPQMAQLRADHFSLPIIGSSEFETRLGKDGTKEAIAVPMGRESKDCGHELGRKPLEGEREGLQLRHNASSWLVLMHRPRNGYGCSGLAKLSQSAVEGADDRPIRGMQKEGIGKNGSHALGDYHVYIVLKTYRPLIETGDPSPNEKDELL